MIRPLLLATLLAAMPLAGATGIKEYAVRLQVQPDGSAQADATLRLTGCMPGLLHIPFAFTDAKGLQVARAPEGTLLETAQHGSGQPHLHATLPAGVGDKVELLFSFQVPKAISATETGRGSGTTTTRFVKHAFVNTQELEIGDYRIETLLPPGTMVQAIREQLPKVGKTESEPRVRLGKSEAFQSATLRVKKLKQGDATSMSVEITETRKSPVWLIAGLVLGGLYLIYFRRDHLPATTT